MTEITKEKITARIRVAAEALSLPAGDVDHVIRNGTNTRTGKACVVLCEFAMKHGVSTEYLISGDLVATFRCASHMLRDGRSRGASEVKAA